MSVEQGTLTSFETSLTQWVTVADALADVPEDAHNHVIRWPSESVRERWHKREFGVDVYDPSFGHQFKLDPEKPSNTVTTSNRHFHSFEPRTLTIRECARLSSFPDTFVFTGTLTNQQRQVGNAVPPLLARRLAEAATAEFEEIRLPYVGTADVLGSVCYDGEGRELLQSSNGNEAYQVRGLRSMRPTSEPAYTVLSAGPAALYPVGFEGKEGLDRSDVRVRMLTEQEMALLQSFSADYEFKGRNKTSLRRQIGNAVPPLLARRLAEAAIVET